VTRPGSNRAALLLHLHFPPSADPRRRAGGPAHGVKIAPGSIFSNSDRFDGDIRLACPRVFDVSDAAYEAAFDTLGRLVREAMAAA